MRDIIINLAVSLDGFIEGPKGEFDWCFNDQDYGMTSFLKRIDTIFFGRKSYQLLLKIGKDPFPGKTKTVFSTTLKNVDDKTILISENFEERVNNIIGQQGKDIWLFGGAGLISRFLKAGFVDEIQLAIHPILLGNGKPLFKGINERINFTFMDTKIYSSGLVQLFYRRNLKLMEENNGY
jgi:dihydrofolate reductase